VGEYDAYMDGKPAPTARARSSARGIELAEGGPDDPPGAKTVQALGNRRTGSCCAGSARMARKRSAARSATSGPPGNAGLVADLAELLEEP
jgi:hypothetical protein